MARKACQVQNKKNITFVIIYQRSLDKAMKVGDLIRYRMSWTHDEHGDVVQPRLDGGGWSGPVLVIYEYPPPDEGLFIS